MPMKATIRHATQPAHREQTAPTLALTVQYQLEAPLLPRWRVRRWVQQALNTAASDAAGSSVFHGMQLTLRIVDAEEGRALNHDFRQRDVATNVLTFEYGQDAEGIFHGDVVLCLPVMQAEAHAQGKLPLHHAAHLVVHGTLHALGFDHLDAADAQRMEGLETRVLARLGIADPYR